MTKSCPSCKNSNIAKILYGLPEMSDRLEKDINDGKIVLGGCTILEDTPSPKYHCNACGKEF